MINHNTSTKLFFLAKVILIYLLFCINISSSEQSINEKLITVGINDAPIKIKVFSSLTCPHCANFHKDVYPKLAKKESHIIQFPFLCTILRSPYHYLTICYNPNHNLVLF